MRHWIIAAACLAALLCAGCGADPDVLLQNGASQTEDADAFVEDGSAMEQDDAYEESQDSSGEDASEIDVPDVIYVYICGAVSNPGVYELSEGDRIYQLVDMAGGLADDADEQSVNLAGIISDGDMVWIPTVEESAAGVTVSGDTAGTAAAGTSDQSGKVNINTADLSELTSLNGIGESKAEAIISYREAHGAFQSIEEIMQVDGIAEGTYAKIMDYITV